MTEQEFNEFAKKVEADLKAHDPSWAEYPFGTEAGLMEQYGQTFDGVGTIFYYVVQQNPYDGEYFRNTAMLDASDDKTPDAGDGIPTIEAPTPPEASDLVYYGEEPPETPALSPIWFDTITGDIRIWYSYNGVESWVNTGVAGVGKIEFMNDLQDVDTSTIPAVDEDHLQFNIGMNKWIPFDLHGHMDATYSGVAHEHTIDELSNVTIDTPENDQILVYQNGDWINKSFDSVSVWTGDTAPTAPSKYPIWFNTTTGFTAIFYDDGTSQQWVNIGGSDARVNPDLAPYSFLAKCNPSFDWTVAGAYITVPFNISGTGSYDTDSFFNNITHQYTIPVDCIYTFNVALRLDTLSHSSYVYCVLVKNGVNHMYYIQGNTESTNYHGLSFTTTQTVDANDVWEIKLYSATDAVFTITNQSWFSGTMEHLL